MWFVGLAWTASQLVGPAEVGVVLAASSMPRAVMLLVGGAVSDRAGPKRTMVVSDLLRAATLGVTAVAVLLAGANLAPLICCAVTLGTASAFFTPAAGAFRPLLLPAGRMAAGNALFSLGVRGGQSLGAPAGSALLVMGGIPMVAIANALTFVTSAVAVLITRTPDAQISPEPNFRSRAGHSIRRDVVEGFRYIIGLRRLRALVLFIGLSEFGFAAPLNAGLPLLAASRGWNAGGIGQLLAVFTVSSAVGFAAVLRWPPQARTGPVILASTGVQAFALLMLGVVPHWPTALVAMAFVGLASAPLATASISLLQLWSKSAMRGRVTAAYSLLTFLGLPLGSILIGLLAEAVKIDIAVAFFAACELLALCYAAIHPELRTASSVA